MTRCHKLLKPSPHYVVIKSTLRFDDTGVVPDLLPLLRAVQWSRMWSRQWSGRRPGNVQCPNKLGLYYTIVCIAGHCSCDISAVWLSITQKRLEATLSGSTQTVDTYTVFSPELEILLLRYHAGLYLGRGGGGIFFKG